MNRFIQIFGLKNYRPVSNLSSISKILEKVVAIRSQAHNLKKKHFSNPLQLAYRDSSTESTW